MSFTHAQFLFIIIDEIPLSAVSELVQQFWGEFHNFRTLFLAIIL